MAEIQLLADQDLMSLWEQTQLAAFAIESRGGNAGMAHSYEQAIIQEIQQRQAVRPADSLFGEVSSKRDTTGDVLPQIMVMHA